MNTFKIVSYATENTPYTDILRDYLEKSLDKISPTINYGLSNYPNLGSWQLNTAYKSQLILDSLKNTSYDAIVFIDADATVEQYPKLFEEIPAEYDIAVHMLEHDTWYQNGSHQYELLSGTMWLRRNDKVIRLIEDWANRVKKSAMWEQKVLALTLKFHPEINIFNLPLEYCYINTLPDGQAPLVKCDNVVVRHHQLSRQTKKLLRGKGL